MIFIPSSSALMTTLSLILYFSEFNGDDYLTFSTYFYDIPHRPTKVLHLGLK